MAASTDRAPGAHEVELIWIIEAIDLAHRTDAAGS